jgi:hypothetical protein
VRRTRINARNVRGSAGLRTATQQLASLVASLGGSWWDKRTGITIATGVSAWVDRVASQTISQGTASLQPAYDATTGVSPDGVDDILSGTMAALVGAPGATDFFCGTMNTAAAQFYAGLGTAAGGRFSWNGTGANVRADVNTAGALFQEWTSGAGATTFGVYMSQFQWADGVTGIKATQKNSASLGGSRTVAQDISAGSFAASSLVTLGNRPNPATYGACACRHRVVIPSQITQAQIDSITTLLRAIEGF